MYYELLKICVLLFASNPPRKLVLFYMNSDKKWVALFTSICLSVRTVWYEINCIVV